MASYGTTLAQAELAKIRDAWYEVASIARRAEQIAAATPCESFDELAWEMEKVFMEHGYQYYARPYQILDKMRATVRQALAPVPVQGAEKGSAE